ncbi:MAG TPA: MFS transporter, partial [Ktedonobacterales bacterium]
MTAQQLQERPATRSLWRNPSIVALFAGQMVSNAGTGATQIALPLVVLAYTGSVLNASILAALRLAVYALLALPAGTLIDAVARGAKRQIMISCEALRAGLLVSMPLTLIAAPHDLAFPLLFVIVAAEALCWAVFDLAVTAVMPTLIPMNQMRSASSVTTLTNNMEGLIGQPLSAALLQIGRAVPFVVDAATYVVSSISLLFVRLPAAPYVKTPASLNPFTGVRFLMRHPLLRTLALLCSLANLTLGGYTLLLLVLSQRLHATPIDTGVMFIGAGLGALLGPILVQTVGARAPFAPLFLGGLLVECALWPLHLLAPSAQALGGLSLATMTADQIMNTVQYELRQLLLPETHRGRVQAAYKLLLQLSQPIGLTLLGLGLTQLGVETTTLLACGALTTGSLLALASPVIRRAQVPTQQGEE